MALDAIIQVALRVFRPPQLRRILRAKEMLLTGHVLDPLHGLVCPMAVALGLRANDFPEDMGSGALLYQAAHQQKVRRFHINPTDLVGISYDTALLLSTRKDVRRVVRVLLNAKLKKGRAT